MSDKVTEEVVPSAADGVAKNASAGKCTSMRKVLAFAFGFLLCVLGDLYLFYIVDLDNRRVVELLKPTMLQLAEQGKPDAISWAFNHHLPGYEDRMDVLRKMAEGGDSSAMYRYSKRLKRSGDAASADRWLNKSSAEGNDLAMLEVLQRTTTQQ